MLCKEVTNLSSDSVIYGSTVAVIVEQEMELNFLQFRCPESLPPSVMITGGWDTLNNCKV